ncbi:MAG: YadA C-terminal domain-containing protein [Pseudomonadales bacterium]|nr:YadA C-terminal domain-containing protein [Pseudomonadales bacterium]
MKKIALAIAMATSASFASAQLTFGPGAIQDQQGCDFPGDNGVSTLPANQCGTTSYSFGEAAYNAAQAVDTAAENVATSTQDVIDAQTDFNLIAPNLQAGSPEEAALDAAELDLIAANTAKDEADQTLANYQTVDGDVSSAAISYYQAETVQQDKLDIRDEAFIEEAAAAAALAPFSADVIATEALRDAALDDYVDADDALDAAIAANPNDPGIPALEAAKNTAVQNYTDANSDYNDAVTAEIAPLAEYNTALNELTTADGELATANDSLADSQEAYTTLINDWTQNVDSTVDSAEFDLLVAEQQRDSEQLDLNTAQAALTSEEGELQAAQDATVVQQGVITAAESVAADAAAAVNTAQLAVDNATPEELAAAQATLLAAQQDQVAADANVLNELAALIPFDAAEDAAETEVAGAQANVDAAQAIVDASTDVAPFQAALDQLIANNAPIADINAAQALVNGSANVAGLASVRDEAIADQAVHASYLDNQSNPAGALMTSLVEGGPAAQDVVTAVSSNYDSTVDNATAISVETDARVAADLIHTADIATNASDIATNVTAISDETDARVAADVAHTNAIDLNASSINDNAVSIGRLSKDLDVVRSGVAATLAVAGMPLAPTEGWGAAIGTGYFDGESAVAAGVTFRSDRYNFKFAVGTSGGEATGSAGVSWGF